MATPRSLAELLWSADRKTRIRLQQWAITLVIYVASTLVMSAGVRYGVISGAALASWVGFVATGLAIFYVLMRSGMSRDLADAALTEWQIAFGVVTVLWGYVMCGDVRSATLPSLMVILMFGAFSLSWQRMARLTFWSVAALAVIMVAMHRRWPGRYDPRIEISNFLIVAIMLPANSVLAVLLGNLRSRLHAQRAELTVALARIQDLATHDALTGLANRRHVHQLVELERHRAERGGKPFALALVDLDHFKRINDLHGHATGDQALCAFAHEARAAVRACDTVGRWGGEEFLVLMPETDAASARSAVDRLRTRIQALHPVAEAPTIRMTVSAGVAEHSPGELVEETISRADRAMYAAKSAGRNRVAVDAGEEGTRPAAFA